MPKDKDGKNRKFKKYQEKGPREEENNEAELLE